MQRSWVQLPLAPLHVAMAQMEAHRAPNSEVAGSSPAGDAQCPRSSDGRVPGYELGGRGFESLRGCLAALQDAIGEEAVVPGSQDRRTRSDLRGRACARPAAAAARWTVDEPVVVVGKPHDEAQAVWSLADDLVPGRVPHRPDGRLGQH